MSTVTDGPGLRRAIGFLTPVGGAAAPGGLAWFPVVGALVGMAVGATWWLAAQMFPPLVAAVVAVGADLVFTGMLHLDGLCDAADGLLPPIARARRLDVMSSAEVGAFGIGTCVVVLLLRVTSLGSIHASVLLVAALWAASRTWMVVVLLAVPYARRRGLASAFVSERQPIVPAAAAVGLIGSFAAAAAWRPLAGVVAVAGGTAAAALVVALAWRRIGGFTGDVLGAAGVVGETVGLVVACAKW